MRQLESLVRLSEALAKLECQDEVTEKHVKEARRLLSKSIVRVEQPDIYLEDNTNTANGMDIDHPAPTRMEELNRIDGSSSQVVTHNNACKCSNDNVCVATLIKIIKVNF